MSLLSNVFSSRIMSIASASMCVMLLSACGFEPMHDRTKKNNLSSHLAQIEISPIPNREGQILKSCLEDRFYGNGEAAQKKYRLTVGLSITKQANIIAASGEIGRYVIPIVSPYSLHDITQQKSIQSSSLSQYVSYNVSDENYATYMASENAVKEGLGELCEHYALQIGSTLSQYK